MNVITTGTMISCFILILSCSGNKKLETAETNSKQTSQVVLDGKPISVAGVTFRPPSVWKDLGPSGMKRANYEYGPIGKETDSACVAVYFFGPSSGGGVEQNIERWISQISIPGGGDPHDLAVRNNISVNGMTAHMVELSGTYNASMGGPMPTTSAPKEKYHLVGVVLEAPQGNVFFKLTGPDSTAEVMGEGLKSMIMKIKKAD